MLGCIVMLGIPSEPGYACALRGEKALALMIWNTGGKPFSCWV